MTSSNNIPHPPRKPFIGNLPQVMGDETIQQMIKLSAQFDGIFEILLPGARFAVVSSAALIEELCDESRFGKFVGGALAEVRNLAGDGLFTAHSHEPNWNKAHNILAPGFGMKSMKEYLPTMIKIARQLTEKWSRVGINGVNVVDDMTRLTLETISMCGFDYTFHSFDSEKLHPFLDAMVNTLSESMRRVKRLKVQKYFAFKANRKFEDDIKFMHSLVDDVINERLKNSEKYKGKLDFLSLMLDGIDRKTGTKLDYTNIRFQLLTFLIAGHETTSGMLSFSIYNLIKHPAILAQAIAEVDSVLGRDLNRDITFKDVSDLKLIGRILNESLRLYPTAPAFAVSPQQEQTIGGKYKFLPGERALVLTYMLHRDKSVWGENADKFNPDNFLHENEKLRPSHAYRPFGNGMRACIGRHFAMVEATIALAMVLQRFKLEDAWNYKLEIKEALTIKPNEFILKAIERTDCINLVSRNAAVI